MLESQVKRKQHERLQYIDEIMILTEKYNRNERCTQIEHRQIVQRCDWDSKLLTTKVFANILSIMALDRAQAAFNEIRIFSDFDKSSQRKLRVLASNLEKLGRHIQRENFNKWYLRSTRPFLTQQQNLTLASITFRKQMKRRVFHALSNFKHL